MNGTKIIKINKIEEARGTLCPIHLSDIPFDVKRLFYVYNVADQEVRGKHAHHETKQVLICLKGVCYVKCKNSRSEVEYILDDPAKGLLIDKMIWDEQVYKTKDTILLVLSSTEYNKNDYIVDWKNYCKLLED